MNIPATDAAAADFVWRMTNGAPCLTSVRNSFVQQASTMRLYAEKARKSKGGVYRGYTVESAEANAARALHRAEAVPAILRERMTGL